MAACDIVILLDDPNLPRSGGQVVTGTAVIRTEKAVKCSALTVSTFWSTHGRGNIASGQIDQQVVFQGTWDENQEYRYPFKLKTAAWPPTYHGSYLNVGQYVHVRASVPWSFDPKAQVGYPVVATEAPEDLQPTTAKKTDSTVAWVIGIVVLLVFLPLLGFAMVFFVPLALILGAGYWFFRIFLPKQITGPVDCELQSLRIVAGQKTSGSLRFTPRKASTINGISWTVTATEKCSSGSGSNRKTHTHELLKLDHTLSESRQLAPGKLEQYELDCPIPANAPPSLKFTDNELNWVGCVRIDIPGWPDFVKEFKLTVVPSNSVVQIPAGFGDQSELEDEDEDEEESSGEIASNEASTLMPESVSHDQQEIAPSVEPATSAAEEMLSFDEVAEQLIACQTDPDKLHLVLGAIEGQTFQMRLDLQGKMYQLPSGVEPNEGEWTLARHRTSDLQVCLWWAPGYDVPRTTAFDWQHRATVIGYDEEQDRLLARVV